MTQQTLDLVKKLYKTLSSDQMRTHLLKILFSEQLELLVDDQDYSDKIVSVLLEIDESKTNFRQLLDLLCQLAALKESHGKNYTSNIYEFFHVCLQFGMGHTKIAEFLKELDSCLSATDKEIRRIAVHIMLESPLKATFIEKIKASILVFMVTLLNTFIVWNKFRNMNLGLSFSKTLIVLEANIDI